jgi:hypothetical protein
MRKSRTNWLSRGVCIAVPHFSRSLVGPREKSGWVQSPGGAAFACGGTRRHFFSQPWRGCSDGHKYKACKRGPRRHTRQQVEKPGGAKRRSYSWIRRCGRNQWRYEGQSRGRCRSMNTDDYQRPGVYTFRTGARPGGPPVPRPREKCWSMYTSDYQRPGVYTFRTGARPEGPPVPRPGRQAGIRMWQKSRAPKVRHSAKNISRVTFDSVAARQIMESLRRFLHLVLQTKWRFTHRCFPAMPCLIGLPANWLRKPLSAAPSALESYEQSHPGLTAGPGHWRPFGPHTRTHRLLNTDDYQRSPA